MEKMNRIDFDGLRGGLKCVHVSECSTPTTFERRVNQILSTPGMEVVDVQYSTAGTESCCWFNCLIIYRDIPA